MDAKFDHNKEVELLGQWVYDTAMERELTDGWSWKRASEVPGAVLFKDGASCSDIVQR